MEVILLERVAKLGQMGEVVRVRDGFARNYLLKRGKALRATADNRAKFDGMKAELEARNLKAKGEASKAAEKIDGFDILIIRQASESGQLFGSVSVRDIVAALESNGKAIATFISGANPNLPEGTVYGLLVSHVQHHVMEIDAVAKQDWSSEADAWEPMIKQVFSLSDALADGIAKQFPNKFQ